ncbi:MULTISPECIES: hypothetical protein [Olivibacter]|jgi:hypothetical protein|uniref:Uncharacterized protein n=1 Tax=Olivibacter oleidegradans TaxID=760123 RepID=A0ABV6HGH6_9SPHI|nr:MULTISPECIES: hypothetical protein [Olivibacter]MDM8176599.1 hypothetical protein [Olivibacter sp. 47]
MSQLQIELISRVLPILGAPLSLNQLIERNELNDDENKCPFEIF